MTTTSLPFLLDRDEIRHERVDARAITGTVRLDGDFILVEFTLEGSGDIEASTHVARIPLADVTKLTMTGGVLKSPRLVVLVNGEDLLESLPWAHGRQCVMRFRHAHGVALKQLIEEAEVRLAKIRTTSS